MPPNNKREDIVQVALPYDQPAYKLGPQLDEPPVYYQASSSHQELTEDDQDEPTLQVTTRARVTYELDRFNKNEMLIIYNNKADADKLVFLMYTFLRYKFEFTVIETEAVGADIWQKIDQFFQKDFSSVGMAAVVTIIPSQDSQAPEDPTPAGTSNLVQEWDVLNYIDSNQPPTLHGRPKLFISEAPEPFDPLNFAIYRSDTLLIQAKKVPFATGARPLDLLCCKLLTMEGQCNFLDVLTSVSNQAYRIYPEMSAMSTLSTLTKELLLEKQVNTDEQWMQKMYLTILNPDMLNFFLSLSAPCAKLLVDIAESCHNMLTEVE